jgi:hypothetical protein
MTWIAVFCALGCGSSRGSDIPPALLEAIADQNQAPDGGYPSGPYGTAEGDVAQNLCFDAWPDPASAGYAADQLETLCFADFYDPTGEERRLLYVSTAAIWCLACANEYRGTAGLPSLGAQAEARAASGLRVLGTISQDARSQPISIEDTQTWARTFEVDFPFARDDEFRMGLFSNAAVQPFGMLIDLRTMMIVNQFEGDVPAVLWPAVDALLSEASD